MLLIYSWKDGIWEEAESFAEIACTKDWQVLSIGFAGGWGEETGKRQIQPMVRCTVVKNGSVVYEAAL